MTIRFDRNPAHLPLIPRSPDASPLYEFHYAGALGLQQGWTPPQPILSSHIAPENDPGLYYAEEEERQTAVWLRDRYGLEMRSIRRRKARRIRTADSWITAIADRLELKHPRSASYLTLIDHIVKGASQSARVLVRSYVPYPQLLAENALAEALDRNGSVLDTVAIECSGGGLLVWNR